MVFRGMGRGLIEAPWSGNPPAGLRFRFSAAWAAASLKHRGRLGLLHRPVRFSAAWAAASLKLVPSHEVCEVRSAVFRGMGRGLIEAAGGPPPDSRTGATVFRGMGRGLIEAL